MQRRRVARLADPVTTLTASTSTWLRFPPVSVSPPLPVSSAVTLGSGHLPNYDLALTLPADAPVSNEVHTVSFRGQDFNVAFRVTQLNPQLGLMRWRTRGTEQ